MKTSVLIGYFDKLSEAQSAFVKLQQKGFRRAAYVSKDMEGRAERQDPFRSRFLLVAAVFIFFGVLAAWISMNLGLLGSVFRGSYLTLIPVLMGGCFGGLLSAALMRRSRFGIERKLLEDHTRWLSPGETVLMVRGPIESFRVPFNILLKSGENPPTIFSLQPLRDGPVLENPDNIGTLLTPSQREDYAKRLAKEHRLNNAPVRNSELLKRLEQGRKWVQRVCLSLSEASHLQQSVPPAAEWLLDNEYILESTARDVKMNVPRNFYRQLPSLASEQDRGLPRTYSLARELASHTELRFDEDNVLAFIEAYQTVKPLSIGELWVVPQMIRTVLLQGVQRIADRAFAELREREFANFWANRLIMANRKGQGQIFSMMAELAEAHQNPSAFFAVQLMDYLYDEGAVLTSVRSWLENTFHETLNELNLQVANRQSKDQLFIGNAFNSLRQLALLDWKKCFERISLVEQALRKDPAGIYPQMDFDTRDQYRRAVEDLHRGSGLAEDEVASRVVEMAAETGTDKSDDALLSHVGTYLIGEKRGESADRIGCRETFGFRVLRWARRHHTAVYFSGLGVFSAVFIFLTIHFGLRTDIFWKLGVAAILLLIPVSQLSLEIVNYLVTRIFPPCTLPKMDFKLSGIPDAYRTLVVVPIMLMDPKTIAAEAEKLEIRYLANAEDNLIFGLFTDYKDASETHTEEDASLLQIATRSIEVLNQRHGPDRFFLFHRERKWCDSEQKFIGWERKRGKLEELNGLIDGTRPSDAERLVYVGDPERLENVRFVITLDSDTQLPHDAARRMIETLAHPLNTAHFDEKGVVRSGYGIIQPRVSPSLPSTNGSPFSRLFSDPVGIDPYTSAVSDAYQDLAGAGSYHGKGIYDVRTFNKLLSGRFPEGLLLSHDLIEGAHVRVGLVSDIELFDEFPQDYLSFAKRQKRWIRGDWQISSWFTSRVPRADGGRTANPLSWFDRWKILDNLRRSFLPAASLSLLVASWSVSARVGGIASALVMAQLFFHSLAQPVTWATTGHGVKGVSVTKKLYDLLQVAAEVAMLPYQAWMALDTTARVLFRKHISHRKLLEWNSAQAAFGSVRNKVPMFLLSLSLASIFSVALGWSVQYQMPESLEMASPWLILWFTSPIVGWLLTRQPQTVQPQFLLPEEDRRFMRGIARRTWRYFSDFVNDETSWLPPDNYQVAYQNKLAMWTSPTNIGLYMVSTLAAHDFGYITIDDIAYKLSRTMETIGKLERHEGHLLNWYNIQTLEPLNPRYVSTVDSGNLLGSLWTLDRGLSALLQKSLMGVTAFAGLLDTGRVLKQVIDDGTRPDIDVQSLDGLLSTFEFPPDSIVDILDVLRRTSKDADNIFKGALDPTVAEESVAYWIRQIQNQLSAWNNIADRYLTWIEILGEKKAEDIAGLDETAVHVFNEALRRAPTLEDLAKGRIPCIVALRGILEKTSADATDLRNWIDRVVNAYKKCKWLAGEALAANLQILWSERELSSSINMNFLYNADRRLFSIGFNVSEGRLDRAFYDLLASEARLGSFVAIARGDVPIEHWFAMNRPYGAVGRHRVLLSWTGTMFEYLMPLLFQHTYANSLLEKSTREAVAIQIAYGLKRKVPWGISECSFGDLDIHKTHQYSAFGVPDLALKRDRLERVVIAPYATMLALDIEPRASVSNLKRLAELGLLTDHGYFEALDFSTQSSRKGTRGTIVRSYMAHHQGMSFLALTNLLHNNSIQRRFHSDPRVRAAESLLYERIPSVPPLHHISTRERASSIASVGDITPAVSQFNTPDTSAPKTQLLCNGRYGVMVTNAGGGYSRWGDFEITRWRSDRTRDSWGTFCYIHDADSKKLWCNTYQPIGGEVIDFSANYTLDRAMFRRVDNGIESETEIVVAPEDDVEIRRMTIINRSLRDRRLDLTSYVELSLSSHNADLKHPAFNKLFIQTEALSDEQTLLAYRRSRGSSDPSLFVAHRLTFDNSAKEALRFETDRRRFIGRGRTLAGPMGASREPENSQGFVLDPIFSLRKSLRLSPGQRIQVSMVMAAGDTREHVLGLMSRYGDPHAINRAMDLAWSSAQLELRLQRIQPDDARRFQQLASHLLYPGLLFRSTAERIAQNRKGQSGLWTYGISGDLPIVLVAIGETRDIGLVRQMIKAHTYWRTHGLMTDLVILNEESGGYARPLCTELEHMIESYSAITGVDQPGGIYLRDAELIPKEDLTLLHAVASVVMVAARGSLSQQLGASLKTPEMPETIATKRDLRDPSAALPFMNLEFFNSLGGFTPDGREYVIYMGPDINTPAPWVNVIANPSFGTLVSETGAGFTWAGNSQRNRLTEWSNDPVINPPSEAIYIRDEETGVFWTPTASPIRERTAYRARHGAGYTAFEHNSNGIEQELTVFVPVDDDGGQPIKLQRLFLKNDTKRSRKLSVTYYAEWTLGESRESSQMHVVTNWDSEAEAVIARNFYNSDYADRVAFAAVSAPAVSYTGDRKTFIGRNRSMKDPEAMERTKLPKQTGAGLDPCAAIQVTLKLAPGEQTEITCMLGETKSVAEARDLVRTYRDDLQLASMLQQTKEWWDNRLGMIEVHTPELAVDFIVNRWMLYQNLVCRIWGRSAFYQSGGAFGFRDQLQDVMAMLYAHPELAREHILYAASRQFREGDVQHWWHPPSGEGIRSKISDDLLWLPFVTAQYIRVTGDAAILHEVSPYLDAPTLKDDQHEIMQVPVASSEKGTLFEHCQRAVEHSQVFGSHGLPLIGTGDWNDGMNLVGAEGRGESVWLAWFLADVLKGMAEMSLLLDRPELSQTYEHDRKKMIEQIDKSAWDGEWYLRATFDDGSLMGSSANAEAKIDSLTQSWAWLSGGGDKDRAVKALESAWKHLVREDDNLVLLLKPPFDKSEPSPGYIRGYPPGVRENGGQYTHAALWMAMAMARSGDGTRAAKMLRIMNPVERARDSAAVWRYGVEPYVAAADVYASPGWVGLGGWTWYTGSAAWMYRAWVEDILGLKIRGDVMQINPTIPKWWDGFEMRYRHGEAFYDIRVENPKHCERGVSFVKLDGRSVKDGIIPLDKELIKHRVIVRLGKPEKVSKKKS